MSLAEIMPAVRMLPREEQLELVRVLSAELESPPKPESEEELLRRFAPPGAIYDIYTPQFPPEASFEAAHILQQLLDERSKQTK
jgi:hypothetical protein